MAEIAKILIAEDDDYARMILSKQLQNENYMVRLAQDGKAAFEMAKEFLPNLVLSDWMMPEMSGAMLCRALKRSSELKGVYFIMLTAKTQIEDIVVGLEGGADDFLTKPYDIKELKARIRTGLRVVELQREIALLYRIEAINQTAITINHEINNPLQAIVMNAELIFYHKNDYDEDTLTRLQKIIDNALRIRQVTKKLEKLVSAESKNYTKDGPKMIDLDRSVVKEI